MRAAWQDKKKEKKRRHGSFDLKEMLQACVSLQQPWPCILIYFNTPKGEFFESYIPFLIDAKRVYTWTSQGHSPGWCHLPLQGFGARQGGETSFLRPPTTLHPLLPGSIAAPAAITMRSGHTFVSWFLIANKILSSFPSLQPFFHSGQWNLWAVTAYIGCISLHVVFSPHNTSCDTQKYFSSTWEGRGRDTKQTEGDSQCQSLCDDLKLEIT